ncbi:MAG: hypothetical protein R3F19_26665 [Verrucomicrobiales bacterium]
MTENILTALSVCRDIGAMSSLVIAADIYETDFESFTTGADQLAGTDGWMNQFRRKCAWN